jgi:prepilin-type N-terminal cleavage/methylation domain-containing protein
MGKVVGEMSPLLNKIKKNRNGGFSLIEVLVAMFILVVVGVSFLITLHYMQKANFLDVAHTTAESLARSQMERIKNDEYIDYSIAGHGTYTNITPDDPSYSIDVTVIPMQADDTPYGETGGVFTGDDGLQKITVSVYKLVEVPEVDAPVTEWDVVVAIEGYKVDR